MLCHHLVSATTCLRVAASKSSGERAGGAATCSESIFIEFECQLASEMKGGKLI